MSLITTTRPVYESCSRATCRRDLREREYVNVLAEAGVPLDRLVRDLFLDVESCCAQDILRGAPEPSQEYVERLEALKAIKLVNPPPFTVVRRDMHEGGPVFIREMSEAIPTHYFVGAEPYYYLVERGENPFTILRHLHINDPVDIKSIVAVTDRPETSFECHACGEYIPHYKYASGVYKKGSPGLLASPDRVGNDCCKETLLSQRLTAEEQREVDYALASARASFSGIPVDRVPLEACISCGSTGPQYYHDYSWLTHHGVPSAISLNYFGLNRVCCRQATMNPQIVPRQSTAVTERSLKQLAAVPSEAEIDYDYSKAYVPPVSGSL